MCMSVVSVSRFCVSVLLFGVLCLPSLSDLFVLSSVSVLFSVMFYVFCSIRLRVHVLGDCLTYFYVVCSVSVFGFSLLCCGSVMCV